MYFYPQGLTPKVDCLASEEIRRLQQQNSTLRAVVTQMRKDMEGLIHLQPQVSSPQPVQHPGAPATTSITTTANTQMTTGSLAQSTGISFKVSPAGVDSMVVDFIIQQISVKKTYSCITCIYCGKIYWAIFVKTSPDYSTLEQEVSLLKARCRHLEGQREGTSLVPPTDKPTEDLAPLLPDNTDLQRLKQGILNLFLLCCSLPPLHEHRIVIR